LRMDILIGYLGPKGTFSEEAARAAGAMAGKAGADSAAGAAEQCRISIEYRAYRSIPSLIAAVGTGEVHYGAVPAENSSEGSISSTWDILLHDSSAIICREILIQVRHHLLAQRGTKLSSIATVLSHPQALSQCRKFLMEKLPNAKLYETTSTAEAARVVSVNSLPLAAIGTEQCASLYGLDIIARDVQDLRDNVTRFLVLAASEEAGRLFATDGCRYKTSIVCAIERDRPGSLYGLLGVFAARQINLTRIESRPSRRGYGDYVFFIDMEAKADDPVVDEALGLLDGKVISLKILGSYPF
jgi:prephenate dehydratase